MINKIQLTKRIAEKAGLLPFDSGQFYEIFLKQLSNRLKPGEVFGVRGLGYFSVKNCRIKSESKSDPANAEKQLSAQMILFSEDGTFNEGNKNIHFFSIPESIAEQEDELASHFSLSLEKPLLNENKFKEENLQSFKKSSEVINGFISKADLLIKNMEKVEGTAEEEFIIYVPTEETVDDTIRSESDKEELLTAPDDTESSSGKDETPKDTFSSLPWDFGRKFFERKVDYPDYDRAEAQTKAETPPAESKSADEEKIIEEAVKEKFNQPARLNVEEQTGKHDEPAKREGADSDLAEALRNEIDRIGKYQRVRTFISSDMKSKQTQRDAAPELSPDETLTTAAEEKIEDDFTPVKSKSETYRLADRKKKRKKRKKEEIWKDSISVLEAKDKYEQYKRKRKFLPYAVSFAVIIAALLVVYLYLEKDSVFSSEPENVIINVTPPPHVNVIERDFEFAVTFPYSKTDGDYEISGIDPSVFRKDVQLVEQKPKIVEPKKQVQTEQKSEKKIQEVPEPKSTIANKNISKYKDYYIVQVAAYKSYAVAEEEAEKFRDRGYNAFIEIAELPGKGTWYRIKVGDFTSIKHAEDFLIKNQNQ